MQKAVVALLEGEQRSATRRVVNLSAQLSSCGARFCDALIFDLSTDGLKARIFGETVPNTHAWVQLPGLEPLACKVVWAKDGDVGFSFLEPITVAMLNQVRSCGPRTWPTGHFGPRAASSRC